MRLYSGILLQLVYRMRSGKQYQCSSTEIEMDENHLYVVIPSKKDDVSEQQQPEVETACMFGLFMYVTILYCLYLA